ncbi:hypothetical protein LCGC14_1785710 [marine sediment metagenome]|uniref:Uncharacterized protein n=1 Tax=marine sediment metagenome TaxID=412755 RepID=A0A0F9JTT1_9ZZZZ
MDAASDVNTDRVYLRFVTTAEVIENCQSLCRGRFPKKFGFTVADTLEGAAILNAVFRRDAWKP